MSRGDLGLDHAGRPADYPTFARAAVAAGYGFEFRYLCFPSTRPINASKVARRDEIDAAHAAGLDVALIWQDTKHDARGGYNAGVWYGTAARHQAEALGAPAGTWIYFAVADYDAPVADHYLLAAYLRGVASATGPYPVAGYGKNTVGDDMLRRGLVAGWWQSYGFSKPTGHIEPWAVCYQRREQVTVNGVLCDVNEQRGDDIGAWKAPVMSTLDAELARRFVPRAAAGLRKPRSVTRFRPDFGDTVHYEGVTLGTFPHSSCPSKVRGIQNYHMDAKRWVDIAYSDLVCPHGYVFEGRGPGVRTAANGTNEGNDSAHATCALLGPGDTVTAELLEGLAVSAARLNRAAGLAQVNGHRDWKPTACPGDPLYAYLLGIKARHDQLLGAAPTPAPAPAQPPITSGPNLPEEAVQVLLVPVPVADDDNNGTGRGYVDLRKGTGGLPATISHDRVVGIFYAGDNPSDGWGPHALAPAECVNAGGVARIVVPAHQVRTGTIGVYVTVTE